MRFRRVARLVAIYLALDFANPLMPGAVQLVGGYFETVAGCQAQSGEAPALAVTMVPCHLSTPCPNGNQGDFGCAGWDGSVPK